MPELPEILLSDFFRIPPKQSSNFTFDYKPFHEMTSLILTIDRILLELQLARLIVS